MDKNQIIKIFKDILYNNSFSFITQYGKMIQGVNFNISNSIPEKTNRTYLKIESLAEAKEIWTEVIDNKEKEEEAKSIFDREVQKLELDLTQDLYLTIYPGQH